MSTRGSIGFRVNNVDRLTYNHFDSYPGGLGEDFVKQCKKLATRSIIGLKKKVISLKSVNEEVPPTKEEIKKLLKYVDTTVGEQSPTDWYCLLRNTQGDLGSILNCGYISESNDFILDSLFCEYAYILNLDDMVLEFYKGFNRQKNSKKGRYSGKIDKENEGSSPTSRYYGCTLVGTVPFKKGLTVNLDELYKNDGR